MTNLCVILKLYQGTGSISMYDQSIFIRESRFEYRRGLNEQCGRVLQLKMISMKTLRKSDRSQLFKK